LGQHIWREQSYLGKCLCLYGEPQWGVVGDTFPVGCAWSDRVVFHDYFVNNPDAKAPEYQTKFMKANCGLENLPHVVRSRWLTGLRHELG